MILFVIVWTVTCLVANFIIPPGALPWRPGRVTWLLVSLAIYGLSGLKIVDQWERVPVMRLGRYQYAAGPGLVWVEPLLNKMLNAVGVADASTKLNVESVPTHDNVRLTLEANLVARLVDVPKYTVEVANPSVAVLQRAQSAIAECVAGWPLDRILAERTEFSRLVVTSLSGKIGVWGVEVRAFEIMDLKITDADIERAMAMKARAEKEAQAELSRAQMQVEIARHLVIAAGELSPEAWRLKGLETLTELTRSAQNNTILIPSELLGALTGLIRTEGTKAP